MLLTALPANHVVVSLIHIHDVWQSSLPCAIRNHQHFDAYLTLQSIMELSAECKLEYV